MLSKTSGSSLAHILKIGLKTCEKGGGNPASEGFGKDFYRKGNSVKRSGHSVNRRNLKIEK